MLKGHFTQECFQKSGEKTSYDLLPNIDDMVDQEREIARGSGSAKKKKKVGANTKFVIILSSDIRCLYVGYILQLI